MRSDWWKITSEKIEAEQPLASRLSRSVIVSDVDGGSTVLNRADRSIRLITGEIAWQSTISQGDKDKKLRITTELLKFLFHVS
jgi:hypothetical protein